MASLELRNGIWHIRWRDRRGKSRSESTKLHASPKNDVLAQKKLQAFEVDLLRGKEPGRTLKISSLLDDVINDFTINNKKSLTHAKLRIENHLRPWFGAMKVEALGADDIREYTKARQAAAASNGTINRELSLLRRGFSLAVQAEKLDRIPYFPKLKESPPRPGFIERAELERLCQHLPEYLRPVIRFGFLTGWRMGEIRQLLWRHVHFDTGEIRLDPGMTKNGEGRVFPMTDELRSLLDGLRNQRDGRSRVLEANHPAQPTVSPIGPDVIGNKVATVTPFVFVRRLKESGRVLPIGDIRKAWAWAVYKAGLPCTVHLSDTEIDWIEPHIVPHCLRASAIIDMDQRGIPPRVIMDLTGHKTIDMHLRYRKVSTKDLNAARELMEKPHMASRKRR